jgi:F-type H+-transporting ATPase subunit alpha
MDRMTDAEQAVREEVAKIPPEVRARFDTADKLTDEDRETIIEITRQALARFHHNPESQPEAKAGAHPASGTVPAPEQKLEAGPAPKLQTAVTKPEAPLKEKP